MPRFSRNGAGKTCSHTAPAALISFTEVGPDMGKNFRIRWWYPLAAALLLAIAALVQQSRSAAANASTEPPVLVIDAGHGGADGGASAADGTLESDINLDIALRLEALARFWGAKTLMTRTGQNIAYPSDAGSIAEKKIADQHARLGLVNNTPGAVLLSIHQNKYPAPSPHGIQVFYGSVPGSDALAELTQANLTALLCPDNRRVAAPADKGVYLMKNANCTAVLVECGFLSNPGDLADLRDGGYRMKLAAVMLGSYLQYIRGAST